MLQSRTSSVVKHPNRAYRSERGMETSAGIPT